MSAHDGAVDQSVLVVSLSGQMLENLLPNPAFPPATETGMHHPEITEPFRQIAPGNTGPVAVQNRIDE